MNNFTYLIGDLPENLNGELLEILCECDNEFYPPLSSRESTTQSNFDNKTSANCKPIEYFNQLKSQSFILVFSNNTLCAFISFKKDAVIKQYYISTLCVKPSFRGLGLLHIMYDKLEELAKSEGVTSFLTRTWSTNNAQLKTLTKHGYKILKTIENDRPNGVGTVYFEKKL